MREKLEIILPSFLREECLERCYKSIRGYYKDIVIRICDDGNMSDPGWDAVFYKFPFYSGVSAKRNFLVQQVKTPYFLTLDDDHVFTEKTDLAALMRVIESNESVGVVGCTITQGGARRFDAGHLEVTYSEEEGRRITRYTYGEKAPLVKVAGVDCIDCRMLSGIFICNTGFFRKYGIKWRDEMKRSDHYPFFLDFPNWLKIYCVPSVEIGHIPDRPEEYMLYKGNDMYHRMSRERVCRFKRLYE